MPIGKKGVNIPATADSPSAKKVFSCRLSPTATNPHPVNVPALKKNQKKLEKYLFFFKKVLTIGIGNAILYIEGTTTTEYQNGSGATSGEGDHRQGIRVT
jgi:hypothetical protein